MGTTVYRFLNAFNTFNKHDYFVNFLANFIYTALCKGVINKLVYEQEVVISERSVYLGKLVSGEEVSFWGSWYQGKK